MISGHLLPDPLAAVAAGASVPVLFLEFGLLLVVLGLLARLAHRLRVSAVPFYLVVGLVFGQGGVVGINASDEFVQAVAELGVVVLLLLLGLDYSGRQLVATARGTARSGVVDLVLNALPGVVLAWFLGWGATGMVALGGVTYISSSGIVSQLMRDFGVGGSPEGREIVGLLVFEDLVMAPYLPVLAALLTGASLAGGLAGVVVAVAVVAVVITISATGSPRTFRVLTTRDPVSLLLLVFGAAIAAAGAAGLMGFSGAVAAFLVGLLLTGEIADVARARLSPLRDMLAAVFFAYFGITTDPRQIPAVLLPAALLAAVSIAAKFLTARTLPGLSGAARRKAGALLSARGEFSVLIAGLVAASAALPPQFEALVATYVILTATAATILTKVLSHREGPAGGDPDGAAPAPPAHRPGQPGTAPAPGRWDEGPARPAIDH